MRAAGRLGGPGWTRTDLHVPNTPCACGTSTSFRETRVGPAQALGLDRHAPLSVEAIARCDRRGDRSLRSRHALMPANSTAIIGCIRTFDDAVAVLGKRQVALQVHTGNTAAADLGPTRGAD